MIGLLDVLRLQGIELGRCKIHFATVGNGDSKPLDAYCKGLFREWQEEQNAKNFECDTIISLIHRHADQWLFAGVYRVLGVEQVGIKYIYKTELVTGKDNLHGCILIRYRRSFRNSYVWGAKFGQELVVSNLQEQPFSMVEEFRGFNRVLIEHDQLRLIVQLNLESWRSALSSVGGVYLVKDRKTGKGYIGIAHGEGGIWKRWCCYIDTSHGDNEDLKGLIEGDGMYAQNFQYAILEIADRSVMPKQLQAREVHWKKTLMTRKSEFGYNLN